jgi:hypothetical protein
MTGRVGYEHLSPAIFIRPPYSTLTLNERHHNIMGCFAIDTQGEFPYASAYK